MSARTAERCPNDSDGRGHHKRRHPHDWLSPALPGPGLPAYHRCRGLRQPARRGTSQWQHAGCHDKPFSLACEENQAPILAVIGPLFATARRVLEIGSGTGQHAVYFATRLPHLIWQTSDVPAQLPGIRLWLAEAQLPNLPEPLSLDVTGDWPAGAVRRRLQRQHRPHHGSAGGRPDVPRRRPDLGAWCTLRTLWPVQRRRTASSESNARFDASLKARDPRMGVRNWTICGRWRIRRVWSCAPITPCRSTIGRWFGTGATRQEHDRIRQRGLSSGA